MSATIRETRERLREARAKFAESARLLDAGASKEDAIAALPAGYQPRARFLLGNREALRYAAEDAMRMRDELLALGDAELRAEIEEKRRFEEEG